MNVSVKWLVTILACLALGTVLLLVERGDAGPADASRWWRAGANDPVRLLLLRRDGTFRRYTKPAIALWFAGFLTIIWLVL